MSAEAFFAYARERYRILLRRRGDTAGGWTEALPKSGKWTNDHILQQYRFCNVFREDDTTTKWIRERVTDSAYGDRVLGALVIARWFNRIATLERLLPPASAETPYWRSNLLYNYDLVAAWKLAMRERLTDVHPLVTGAYMIKTPAKMTKLEGLLWCLDHILRDALHLACEMANDDGYTLERATKRLAEYPYLGPFMAYEVVTDLRHTKLLNTAPDIMTWANSGPGAVRGAGRVCARDPGHFSASQFDQDMIQKTMKRLLVESTKGHNWPMEWPSWEMRDVEHTLCEFDKYMRARLGQGRPKQKYDGGLT